MSRISIIVEFTPKPGCFEAFSDHIRAHAKATLAEEPGCERFDVMEVADSEGHPGHARIMLVEVYADMAAVRAHRANRRMPKVSEGSAPLLESRTLTMCVLK